MIIDRKANVNPISNTDYPLLAYTLQRGFLDFSSLLLENGADPNFMDNATPIWMYAMHSGSIDVMELVYKHGAV